MKQNMKRMLLVLCMAVCFFALSACGSASEEAVEPISPEIEQTMSAMALRAIWSSSPATVTKIWQHS